MKEKQIVVIVGAGMMGSALAFPARENGHEVRLVGTLLDRAIIDACRRTGQHPKFNKPFPAGVNYFQIEELDAALEGADTVIGGVSSFGVDWFAEFVLPRIPRGVPVLTVTKGVIDLPSGEWITYPEYWQEKCAARGIEVDLNAIGGPCTSYELVAHDQTEVAFCGKNRETLRRLKSVMETDYYHISLTDDVTGIETAVALKNGYALGIALTIGVNQRVFGVNSELHFNSQAAVFGQATREMSRLLAVRGVNTENNRAVGFGDLYVTVYGGRTRQIGILLGRGMDIDRAQEELAGVTLESLVVARRVANCVRIKAAKGELALSDFPLLLHVDDILCKKTPVNIPWDAFTYEEL